MKVHLGKIVAGIILCVPVLTIRALPEYGSGFSVIRNHVYSYQKGRISAREVKGGKVLWDMPVQASGGGIDVGPIEEDGVVSFCAGGSAQRILALDIATGKLLWDADGYCRAITSEGGRIFVLHRPDGSISSFDARSGKRLWKSAGNGPASKIVVLKNRIITDNIQLAEDTGRTIRKDRLHRVLLGVANEDLFWEGSLGDLICSTLNGHDLWHLSMPLPRIVQFQSDTSGEFVAAYSDYPYVGTSGILLKLDQNGHELWRTPISTGLPLPSSPFAQFKDQLMVLLPIDSQHSMVRVISKTTGLEVWASLPLEDVVGPVVESDEELLVGRRDGQINVISRSTGSTKQF